MILTIYTPLENFQDTGVEKIIVEGEKGFFCLLEHHIDYVESLPAGIITYSKGKSKEFYVAIDQGILVKKGGEVSFSVRSAYKSNSLENLKNVVTEQYEKMEDDEKKMNELLVKLESDFNRLLLEMK